MVLVVAASVALVLASRDVGSARDRAWKPLISLALALGLAAVVLQGIEYARLGFGPADGGYASVFAAWTGLNALFVLGTTLWAETLTSSFCSLAIPSESGKSSGMAAAAGDAAVALDEVDVVGAGSVGAPS